mgnify:CR=1 FL=1
MIYLTPLTNGMMLILSAELVFPITLRDKRVLSGIYVTSFLSTSPNIITKMFRMIPKKMAIKKENFPN